MSGAITAAVAAPIIGGLIAGEGAESQATAMKDSAALQYKAAQENLEFAKEQWDMYETRILPLELEAQGMGIAAQELALQRGEDEYQMYQDYYQPMQVKMSEIAMEGSEDRTEQVTRDAATRVSQEFERSKEVTRRNLSRAGVRPDSGRAEGGERQAGLSEAATRSGEVNRAREGEQVRQETSNFNMLGAATGRAPAPYAPTQQGGQAGLNPSQTAAMIGNANTAAGNSSLTAANAAGLQYATYGNMASGAMQGVSSGISAYNALPSSGGGSPSSYNMAQTQTGTAQAPGSQAEFDAFTDGGLVPRKGGYVNTYADGGKVEKGDKKDSAAVQAAKENTGLIGFAARWLGDHKKKMDEQIRRDTGNYADGGQVSGAPGVDNVPAVIDGQEPAKISSGEYVIPTDVVAAKGTEFFDKLLESYHAGPTPGGAGLTKGAQ